MRLLGTRPGDRESRKGILRHMKTTKKYEMHDDSLYRSILSIEDAKECYDFFVDLCTIAELAAFEQRFEVARLLRQGHSYNEILEKTGASSATISRVNRTLNYGTGGYDKVISRLGKDV